MTSEQARVPIGLVRHRAGEVDRTADAIREVRSAVREVTMDSSAYGQLCQFLPALLTPVFGLAVAALNESVDALRETAGGLRVVADSTEATDERSADRVTAAGSTSRSLLELPL